MAIHYITTPMPTAEEMADYLGVSRERLARIREIMNSPVPRDERSNPLAGRKPVAKTRARSKNGVARKNAHRAKATR